ncbi:hypothetical protein [Olsenella massiliensis]|uniref:hypothetical protein n=1 Tax=Olsenella massiliensis TaxID=1622075 RepID=UPI00071DA3B9|nr:hypothetical protein [Olsenella massiliensis]
MGLPGTITSNRTAACRQASQLETATSSYDAVRFSSLAGAADGLPPSAHDQARSSYLDAAKSYVQAVKQDASALREVAEVLGEVDQEVANKLTVGMGELP